MNSIIIFKKSLTIVILATMLVMTLGISQVMALPHSIVVDGITLPEETQIEISEDRIMIQLNEVLKALKADYEWMEATREIHIQHDGNIRMNIDTGAMTINNHAVKIEPTPYVSRNRIMVPLKFMSEMLGKRVIWDNLSKTATISSIDTDLNERATETIDEQTIEEDGRVTLSLEEAIDKAISSNISLQNRFLTVLQLDEQRARSEENFINTRPISDAGWIADIQNKQVLLGLIQTEINLEISKMQAEIDEERIAYTVTNLFHDIINLENDIESMEAMEEIRVLDHRFNQIKYEQGLISQTALNASAEELLQLQERKNSLQRSKDTAYQQLSTMTSISNISNYRIENLPIEYEVLPEINITSHASRKSSVDPYVRLQERQIESAEANLRLYVSFGNDTPYEVRRLEVESQKNSLRELKQKLEDSLRSRYQSIRQLENQHRIADSELKTLNEQLSVLETQLELGMVTEKDVLEMRVAVMSKYNEVKKLQMQHKQLQTIFDAPYLAPDYLN